MLEPQTLARPYANAIFEHAKQQEKLEEWFNVLALLAQVCENQELRTWLKSNIPSEQKVRVIMQILAKQPQDVHNAVSLLAEKKRIDLLDVIFQQYSLSKRLYEHKQKVQVRSAYFLTPAQQIDLQQVLTKKIGRNVELDIQVDSALIGGVIIQMGDEVYDYSIKGQLNQLSQALLTVTA